MKHPSRAIIFGFLVWLIPFVIAFPIFPLKQSGSPLFETVMLLAVVGVGTVFVCLYFARVTEQFVREGLFVVLLWMAISLVIDLALFMWGPMKMTFPAYMADIGLGYLAYPIMATGIGLLLARRNRA